MTSNLILFIFRRGGEKVGAAVVAVGGAAVVGLQALGKKEEEEEEEEEKGKHISVSLSLSGSP